MISDDVRLEVVTNPHERQAEASSYFGNYSKIDDWHLVRGWSKAARRSWCSTPGAVRAAKYFRAAAMARDKIAGIRDFRYAPLRHGRR